MMQALTYKENELYFDDIAIKDILKLYGSPCYIYSLKTMEQQITQLRNAFHEIPHRIFYAMKANYNLTLLNQFNKHHIGFDIVSEGELKRALKAGAKPTDIIFSGVGKQREEIEIAITEGIHCINVESKQELQQIIQLAEHYQKMVKIAIRINPNIHANTHESISTGLLENKFGIPEEQLSDIFPLLKSPLVDCIGIACHIGSQITTVLPFKQLAIKLCEYVEQCKINNITLSHIDIGGGLGISYDNQPSLSIKAYADAIIPLLKPLGLTLYLEPGRLLIGSAGCLATKILYIKQHEKHSFAICDAGMNDLMRPALYQAHHQIYPLLERTDTKIPYHVVGPICESTDCFAKEYPLAIMQHDYLVFDSTGAYGSSMSSHYNARPLIPEILVVDGKIILIRKRETIEQTYQHEILLN